MDIFKSPLDQLNELLPDTQESNSEHAENAEWLGWDGWVDVGSNHSSTAE